MGNNEGSAMGNRPSARQRQSVRKTGNLTTIRTTSQARPATGNVLSDLEKFDMNDLRTVKTAMSLHLDNVESILRDGFTAVANDDDEDRVDPRGMSRELRAEVTPT